MADRVSLYDVTIAPLTRGLTNLDGLLKKAEEHAAANNISLDDYINARLAPDMAPFTFQVQTVCNTAKFLAVRVGGVENVPMADDETTFPQLHERITRTLELLKGVSRETIDGKEGVEVVFRNMKFTGLSYSTTFAIPNFYFHLVTAYAILRNKGVPIGKLDYLGAA
jgi:uncharacterized protein